MLKRLEIGLSTTARFSNTAPVGSAVRRQYGQLASVEPVWVRIWNWLVA